ncbi:MAG TPA: ABC transporter substrate-binding protein [Ktedonobacteraceae bacterium]|nr:ABC transporter substrate-binding protein [Ktedonobacteraceae bacterium]
MSKLAMFGGPAIVPRDQRTIKWPIVTPDDERAVLRVLGSGKFTSNTEGELEVKQLEEEWAAFVGSQHAVAVSNGTTAIAMAINYDKLITVARNGFATPLCTDHPASLVPGYQANAKCPKYDPAAANALLDQDGWVKGADGVRSKNGLRLDFKYTTTFLAWREAGQTLVQQDLSAIGIKTTLVNQSSDTFFGTTLPQGVPGVYDIGEFENTYTYDADDALTLNCASIPSKANDFGGQNYSFACDPNRDKLFDQEQATTDPVARQAIFNQLHDNYLATFPFITLYAPVNATIVKNTAQCPTRVEHYLPLSSVVLKICRETTCCLFDISSCLIKGQGKTIEKFYKLLCLSQQRGLSHC